MYIPVGGAAVRNVEVGGDPIVVVKVGDEVGTVLGMLERVRASGGYGAVMFFSATAGTADWAVGIEHFVRVVMIVVGDGGSW